MLFFCLPISGQFLCNQLGQLLLFLEAASSFKKADVIFSSSGGNIVAYIAHACNWDINKIKNSFIFFDTEAFISNWSFDKLPFLSFFLNKTMFSKGYGFYNFFKFYYDPNIYTNFSPKAVSGTEILTGVAVNNKEKFYHKIYSNKKKENSLLKYESSTSSPYFCEDDEIEYLGGNVKDISNIVVDSASIPFIVPSRKDSSSSYSDGGTFFSSPFSCFSYVLKEKVSKENEILKGIYFSSSNCDIEPTNSFGVSFLKEFQNFIASSYVQEIRIFINLITSFDNMTPFKSPVKYKNINKDVLKNLLNELESTNYHYGILFFFSGENNKKEYTPNLKLNCKMRLKEINDDVQMGYDNVNCYVWRKN